MMDGIGSRLKFIRKQLGWSQEKMGNFHGVSQSRWQRIETDHSPPTVEMIKTTLEEWDELTADWLLFGKLEDSEDPQEIKTAVQNLHDKIEFKLEEVEEANLKNQVILLQEAVNASGMLLRRQEIVHKVNDAFYSIEVPLAELRLLLTENELTF